MLKKNSLISFTWYYSFFYWFCRFRVIYSLNNFSLLLRICVSILSLPTERDKSQDISIMTRAINKWTTSHGSSRQVRLCYVSIIFLECFLSSKNPKAPWMVSTTVAASTNSYQLASLVELKKKRTCFACRFCYKYTCFARIFFHSGCSQSYEVFRRTNGRESPPSLIYFITNTYQLSWIIEFQKISGSLRS